MATKKSKKKTKKAVKRKTGSTIAKKILKFAKDSDSILRGRNIPQKCRIAGRKLATSKNKKERIEAAKILASCDCRRKTEVAKKAEKYLKTHPKFYCEKK